MSRLRFVAGIAVVAALAAGACGTQMPTFTDTGVTDVPAPRDTTAWVVPGAEI